MSQGVTLKDVEVVYENARDNFRRYYLFIIRIRLPMEPERKLEDVLKKLPGVEVNKDGEIQVEGKTVSKSNVEGKIFFDGDTKIATKTFQPML